MNDLDTVARFLRSYGASAVGPTPAQPEIPDEDENPESTESVILDMELPINEWKPLIVGECGESRRMPGPIH